MNKFIGIGNLTKEVELKKTPSGVSVCQFTIAINRVYKDANGERKADYINCIAWRALAENVAQYCKKGSKVAVCGELQTRSYEANDGSKRYITEVVASEVKFLDKAPGGSTSDVDDDMSGFTVVDEDSLPF